MTSHKFLNAYEEVTYTRLKSVCDAFGARVFPKVRMVDVLRCYGNDPCGDDLSFSLKAHLDFLVVSHENDPLFSVEYDGPIHREDRQKLNDQKKNRLLSQVGLPLLRINSRYLNRRYRGYDLLSYFIEVWFLWLSFEEAQSHGQVPIEEPFDPDWMQPAGTIPWPYNLSRDLRQSIWQLHKGGTLIQQVPYEIIGEDHEGNTRCLTWLMLSSNAGVFVRTGMRRQDFPAVFPPDLLSHVATFDLYDLLRSCLTDGCHSSTAKQISEEIKAFKSKYSIQSALIGGYTVPLAFEESIVLFSNDNQ